MSRSLAIFKISSLFLGLCLVSGCVPVEVTALGVGSSTAVTQTLNGITYRTFTASSSKVKNATLVALNHMEIKLVSTERDKGVEILHAKASGRTVEIQLDPISSNTTRMRVTAKSDGLFYDSATATEIILQTERVMGNST